MRRSKRSVLYSVTLVLGSSLAGVASAETLKGSATVDVNSDEIFASQDPLAGKPQFMPPMTGGGQGARCVPPDPTWRLLYREGNTCVYFMPFRERLSGCVVPLSEIVEVGRRGARCGVNPWEPEVSAVCDPCLLEDDPDKGTSTSYYDSPTDPPSDRGLPAIDADPSPGPPSIPLDDPYRGVPGYQGPGSYNPCFNPRPPPECPDTSGPRFELPKQPNVPPTNPRPLNGGGVEDGVWPPLVVLRDAVNSLNEPHDMTRPHEGLRVIKETLTNMFLGRVLNKVPGVLGKRFGKNIEKEAVEVMEDSASGGIGRGGGGGDEQWGSNGPSLPLAGGTTWTNPPTGVTPPPFLNTTPRPVFPQEMPNSCVEASVKMVSGTVMRKSLPESFYRQLARGDASRLPSYEPSTGTIPQAIPKLLDLAGIKNSGLQATTLDQIAEAANTGYPAIVGVTRGNAAHAVIVDAVVGSPGNRSFFIRDPIDLTRFDAPTRQMLVDAGFTNKAIVSESEFLGSYLGDAVLTMP